MRRAALVVLCLVAAACGGGPTSTPIPGSIDDVSGELVLHGIAIHNAVSGDAGCDEPDLHDNAARLDVSIGTMSSTRTIYLMHWRRHSDYDSMGEAFARCVTSFAERTGSQQVDRVEDSPWRA